MEEHENKLEKAVEALKNEQIPPGPPPELANSTLAKLAENSEQTDSVNQKHRILIFEGLRVTKSLTKIAAAAVLLIAAGYAAGRLSAPRPPDMDQIRAALEPAIRQNLLDETKRYMQLGLANAYIRIKDELSEQYRQDLRQVAKQSVAASNAVTNGLLTELIELFNKAQNQDRQLVAAALGQIESKRQQDRTELTDALTTLALQTEDEFMRTQQNMAQFLSYTQPEQSNRDETGNSEK
jgi:DNA-binding ferritin-like protein (Dps family)